jgi:hypothetical protein
MYVYRYYMSRVGTWLFCLIYDGDLIIDIRGKYNVDDDDDVG